MLNGSGGNPFLQNLVSQSYNTAPAAFPGMVAAAPNPYQMPPQANVYAQNTKLGN